MPVICDVILLTIDAPAASSPAAFILLPEEIRSIEVA
jgi:hypothetical protein